MNRPSLRHCLLFTTLLLTSVSFGGQRREARATDAAPPHEPSATRKEVPFDVDAVIRQVHFAYRPEQDGWRGGHSTYDVKATPQGLTLTPVHYKTLEDPAPSTVRAAGSLPPKMELETGAPLLLGPARITRGSTSLSDEAPRGKVEADGHLALIHRATVEHLRNSEQGVEQSWSFEQAPRGKGDLWVRIPVKGLVHTGTSEQGLHFADARAGLGFRYGHGTWIDGKGRRTPIPAKYANGQIQLRVPEAVLDESAWPAVLDPIISREMFIDGRLVTGDTSVRTASALAFNGTDYLLVWVNTRVGQSILYGTRVSSAGSVLDTYGFAVSHGPGNSLEPHVASNGTDFYVVWSQYFMDNWAVRGTRVTGSGEVSTPGGTRIATATRSQGWPHVASNGTDFLVTFYMRGTDGFDDVYARRVSSTGTLPDSAEIPVATGSGYDETSPVVASNGSVYVVAWADSRTADSHIYATRISNGGVVLDGTGVAVSSATLEFSPAITSNGTDFFIAWLDFRNPGSRDVYGTRVTASGSLSVVDSSGLAVSTTTTIHENFLTVGSNGTDYLVAWTAWSTSPSTFQTRACRVSSSSISASAVLDTTSLVLSTAGNFKKPTVARAGTDYLVAWEGNGSTGGTTTLFNAWVSSTGTVTSGSGFPISASVSSLYQVEPAVAASESSYLVVWTDTSSSGTQIYGVRVTREGGTLDVPPLVLTAAIRERQTPAVASNGMDFFVTWMDFRDTNWDIYGARVLGSGSTSSAVVDPGGFVISANLAFENAPAVASDGTDYFVVWRQEVSGRGDIYGARVTSAGIVQDTSGIALATNLVEHYAPRVASNGSNYLVVWAEDQGLTTWDVYGRRVSDAGSLLDMSSIAISAGAREQYEPDVASDGTDYFVVWTAYSLNESYDIHGARVTGEGVVQDTSGIELCTQIVNQHSPKVTYDGTNYVVAWADYRFDSYWDVYATQVTSSGTVVTPNGFSVVFNARQTGPHLSLASAGGQQSFVAFSRYDTEPNVGSRRIRGQYFAF
jgi:hypothetical protein